MSRSKLLFDRFMFRIICIKRRIAFLLTHSTVASINAKLLTTQYLKSLHLKTSRRIQAKATKCTYISAASLSLNLNSPKPKTLTPLIEAFYPIPLQPMTHYFLNTATPPHIGA
jgi:hypothetical protein